MASLGVFALLNAVAVLRYLQSKLSSSEIKHVFTAGVLIAGVAVFCIVVLLTYAGVIAPWSGRYVPIVLQCKYLANIYEKYKYSFQILFIVGYGVRQDSHSNHCFSLRTSTDYLVFLLF